MAERLTAEERAKMLVWCDEREGLSIYADSAIGMLREALDSLDAAEAEVARLTKEAEAERDEALGNWNEGEELREEVVRLQTLHAGRADFLGVLFKEMTMILEGDCAEAKVRCAINRWCGLFESLEGSEPE